MATAAVRDGSLVVTFSRWERLFVRRSTHQTPVPAVTEAEVREHWSRQMLGVRSGLVVSGLVKIGVWRSPRATRLLCVRRGQPTLRVAVDRERSGGAFDELLISVPNASETCAELLAGTSR